MAKATANCTCATCGAKYTVTNTLRNCREADSWKEWAESHMCECTDCFRARRNAGLAEEAEPLIKKYQLPEITGKSEKQINYAAMLRNAYLADFADVYYPDIDRITSTLSDPDKLRQLLAEYPEDFPGVDAGTPLNLIISRYLLTKYPSSLYTAYKLRRESDAGKIIDLLKH